MDPRATHMIKVDLLEQLLIELTLEELKLTKKVDSDDQGKGKNVLFNLHKHSKLVLYVKFKRNLDRNSDTMKKVKKDYRLQKQMARAF